MRLTQIRNFDFIYPGKEEKKRMKRLIIFIRPYSKYLLVIWLVSIAAVSSIPSLPTPKIDTGKFEIRLDYLFHFCEYGLLAVLAFLTFAKEDFDLPLKKYLIITLALMVFAIADEFHQKLIPGRTFNSKDILSNLAGIIASLVFCFFIFRKVASGIKDHNR
jgi:VanZ family protein